MQWARRLSAFAFRAPVALSFAAAPVFFTPADPLNKYIDHTALKPEVGHADIRALCDEAVRYGFASVCINPVFVPYAYAYLSELGAADDIAVCTVVGFPLGATTTEVKAFEAEQAILNGATEIDMVLPIGLLRQAVCQSDAEARAAVLRDISAVVSVCKRYNVVSKVIFETCLLTPEERDLATLLANAAGADFVKTSTGFSTGGATVEDVSAMEAAETSKQAGLYHGSFVKASGGIRDLEATKAMIAAGASRIGASAGVRIMEEYYGGSGAAAGGSTGSGY